MIHYIESHDFKEEVVESVTVWRCNKKQPNISYRDGFILLVMVYLCHTKSSTEVSNCLSFAVVLSRIKLVPCASAQISYLLPFSTMRVLYCMHFCAHDSLNRHENTISSSLHTFIITSGNSLLPFTSQVSLNSYLPQANGPLPLLEPTQYNMFDLLLTFKNKHLACHADF